MARGDSGPRAPSRRRVLAAVTCIAACCLPLSSYVVWAAVSFACDPLPDPRGALSGEECPAAKADAALVTLCLHHCDMAVSCRHVARWRNAGWAGRVLVVVGGSGAGGREALEGLPVCDGRAERRLLRGATSQHFVWCDKIRAIAEVVDTLGVPVLYTDADLVPARCVGELALGGSLALFRDALCWHCNEFNAGLVWAEPGPAVGSRLAEWERVCRSSDAALRPFFGSPAWGLPRGKPIPDDQKALDVLRSKGGDEWRALPRELPYYQVRYMSSVLWRWLPRPVLWHYTSVVRGFCDIRL